MKFKLHDETLHLTTSIVDRFLSIKNITRSKLQLLGITAMLISAKVQELYAPTVDDFIYISDNAYIREEVLRMEEVILGTLSFDIQVPSSHAFALRWVKVVGQSNTGEFQHLVDYIIQLAMLDFDCLRYLPSMVAAGAVLVALRMFGLSDVNPKLESHSGHSSQSLQHCVSNLSSILRNPTFGQKLPAIQRKFSSPRLSSVAVTVAAVVERDT